MEREKYKKLFEDFKTASSIDDKIKILTDSDMSALTETQMDKLITSLYDQKMIKHFISEVDKIAAKTVAERKANSNGK